MGESEWDSKTENVQEKESKKEREESLKKWKYIYSKKNFNHVSVTHCILSQALGI